MKCWLESGRLGQGSREVALGVWCGEHGTEGSRKHIITQGTTINSGRRLDRPVPELITPDTEKEARGSVPEGGQLEVGSSKAHVFPCGTFSGWICWGLGHLSASVSCHVGGRRGGGKGARHLVVEDKRCSKLGCRVRSDRVIAREGVHAFPAPGPWGFEGQFEG